MGSDLTLTTTCLVIAILGVFALIVEQRHRRGRRDPQRLFTWEQKKVLLAQARHRCEHKAPLWWRCKATTELQADHVVPWTKGGPTELWNGQLLCIRHNKRKTNHMPSLVYRWRLNQRRLRYSR